MFKKLLGALLIAGALFVGAPTLQDVARDHAMVSMIDDQAITDSVVTVHRTDGAYGTGFSISETLIVTNFHVVRDGHTSNTETYVFVQTRNNHMVEGAVIASNEAHDLAIIRIAPGIITQSLRYDVMMPLRGSSVVTVGYPAYEVEATSAGVVGMIYPMNTSHKEWNQAPKWNLRAITTDLEAQGGASGSPVLDETGTVIGILFAGSQKVTLVVPAFYLDVLIKEVIPDEYNRIRGGSSAPLAE
jgi:serine protease Do